MRAKFLVVFSAFLLLTGCSHIDDLCCKLQACCDSLCCCEEPCEQPCPPTCTADELCRVVGDRIFFDFDRSEIRADQRPQVAKWADWLKKCALCVTLTGNCDERGTREYNIALGYRRANSAKTALVQSGIDPQRITVASNGKDRPTVLGSNEAAWAQNRNVIMTINGVQPGAAVVK